MARTTKSARRSVDRQVLGMGLLLLATGLGLWLLGLALRGSSSQALRAFVSLTEIAPYITLFGAVLLLIHWAMRRKPEVSASRMEPTLYPKDTTTFASSLQKPATEPSPGHRGRRPPATTWSAHVFEDIEWRRFEAVCARLFAQAGFEARSQSHGADGGVDIWLHSAHAQGPAAIVQCKHWLGKPVGVKELREFYGVMASHKLSRGTFATTGGFSTEARQFAKDNGIHLLDGHGLLALVARRTAAQQQELLAIAYEGEYWRPTCAACGLKMVERSGRDEGRPFWGCAQYPRCRHTLPLRTAKERVRPFATVG
jgi:restriction system protein